MEIIIKCFGYVRMKTYYLENIVPTFSNRLFAIIFEFLLQKIEKEKNEDMCYVFTNFIKYFDRL